MKIKIPTHVYIYAILVSILILFNIDNPFFWDKDVLDSKQAHWFFFNNFNLNMPELIDAGHPPTVGFLLALLWSAFSKSLIVGHVLMWVVAIGTLLQLHKTTSFLFEKKDTPLVLALVLCETALLTQMVVVSSDLIMTFFFFLSLNAIFNKKQIILLVGLIGLSIISLRGMTMAFGLFLFLCYYRYSNLKDGWKSILSITWPFIIAAIPALSYLVFHYISKGWLVHNENGVWQNCYEQVDFNGFIRNIVVFSWRMLDAGRIIIWAITAYLSFSFFIVHKKQISNSFKHILVLFGIIFSISLPSSLLSANLIDNRYYILLFIIVYFAASYLVIYSPQLSSLKKKVLMGFMILSIASGSFWTYPDQISNCWSATLAHIPYFKLKSEMTKYMTDANIDRKDVGSYIENLSKDKYLYLNDREEKYEGINYEQHEYALYSNVFNIQDHHFIELSTNWEVVKELKSGQVKVILYKKKED